MRNILYDLYESWEDRPIRNSEHITVNNKIKTEIQYFKKSMKPYDFARLEALEILYTQAAEFQETDGFIEGFKLGIRLLYAVFCEE